MKKHNGDAASCHFMNDGHDEKSISRIRNAYFSHLLSLKLRLLGKLVPSKLESAGNA